MLELIPLAFPRPHCHNELNNIFRTFLLFNINNVHSLSELEHSHGFVLTFEKPHCIAVIQMSKQCFALSLHH